MTNLPQGWEKFNFDNIFYSPSSKNYQLNTKDYLGKGCIPIIDQSKKFIIGYSNNYEKIFKINNCNNSCIIFGDHTRVLKFIDFDFIVGADGVKILLNKDIERFNTKFLFFQLLYKDIPLLGYRRHFSVLKQNTFIIPPLKEQERIVEILDESIKILEQDLLNLDELMQSALQKAFNPLKDNAKENYKLPQGWEWKSLEDIANIKGGKRLPKDEKLLDHKTPFPYIRVSDFQDDGTIDLHNVKFINEKTYNILSNYQIDNTNLYISIAGTIGKSGIIPKSLNGAILTENAIKLEYKNYNIYNKFMYYFTISSCFKNQAIGSTRIVAQPKLAISRLKTIQIPLPPLQEQEQIASHLDELSSHVKNLKQNYQMQIKNLQELKKSLLDKAFQGRL
ncbi:restriction endonuclease subunit S [Campylobacter lari]|uniref:restriction endonuclease subunit S n=1 Tax=Campylobacter lari TaxID=201 RepID=UPI0021E690E0|nr:restriction endonuclease subunit S [Campylobacter lari]EKK0830863.1 restriction endonuclease subunit S [Campylobacter lari]MCV3527360.1 restriction endonuclease subunit S [Campylobacter lari]MCW0222824.1 restriction endonuclease subunit S [Campylobacter lari]MCW0241001.1 restriction endonuclease subunit S [Campylobacter lari]HEC1787605.1 restriction endonuclease subunit S [Campylobacter lari]